MTNPDHPRPERPLLGNDAMQMHRFENRLLREALKIFADKYRERMLDDAPVAATNGECRRAKEALRPVTRGNFKARMDAIGPHETAKMFAAQLAKPAGET